jgi:hypothetical protein
VRKGKEEKRVEGRKEKEEMGEKRSGKVGGGKKFKLVEKGRREE